jgi:hypothetical protein
MRLITASRRRAASSSLYLSCSGSEFPVISCMSQALVESWPLMSRAGFVARPYVQTRAWLEPSRAKLGP